VRAANPASAAAKAKIAIRDPPPACGVEEPIPAPRFTGRRKKRAENGKNSDLPRRGEYFGI